MPHSSGGGSHHGGSHGGSHHHSRSHHSSRGGSSTIGRISREPYEGAKRYRYRHRGRTEYFYTTREPGKIISKARLLIGIFYIPFLLTIGALEFPVIRKQIQTRDTSIIIKDEANILEEEAELRASLEAFYEKTKITPAVITINNKTWMNHYDNLEDYAYDRYLAEFNDEMHWLIVYSEPEASDSEDIEWWNGEGLWEENPEDIDWYWEGMQGDDTDDLLTAKVTSVFNYDLQTRLDDETSGVAEDLAKAFDKVTQKVEKNGILHVLKYSLPAVFSLLFILVHAYFMMGLYEWKYRKAEPAPEGEEYYTGIGD